MSKIPEWAEQAAFEAQTAAIRECQDSKLFVIAEYPFVTGSAKEVLDKHISLALVAAEKRGADAKEAEIAALLKDPAAVRVNYLRGGIACQPLIDEAEKRGIERATASIEQAFKDGVEYATIVAVPNTAEDREHAWSISRARAAIRRLGEPHEAARAGK